MRDSALLGTIAGAISNIQLECVYCDAKPFPCHCRSRKAPLVDAQLAGMPMRSASRRGINGALTLGDMVGAFKSITTGEYIRGVQRYSWTPFEQRLWQLNYWEHIVRDEAALLRIQEYIQTNPVRWSQDQFHPMSQPSRFDEE